MGFGDKKKAPLVQKLLQSLHLQQNYKMFEQLQLLLNKQSLKQQQNQGRALDCLKQIPYFNELDEHLGSEYLLALLPTIYPFILRQGFGLINQADLYVHVQGDLKTQQVMFAGNRNVQAGRLIDLRDNPNLRYIAHKDCNMIRIQRGTGSMNQAQKKKLQELEREHNKKMKDYQKLLTQPQHQIKLDIIKTSSFFSELGQYDMYQFTLGCSLKEYSQYMATHQKAEHFNKIGFIVNGKVKITLTTGHAHRKDPGIYWFLNQGDWVGLQQFLWQKPLESSGQVQSIAAVILWIPFESFQAKFNERTNYTAINKLNSLIKTKRSLFQRSLNCRKKKQIEIVDQNNSKSELNPELQAKVEALHAHSARKKGHFSRARFQSNKKREIPFPEQIMHKTMLLSDKPTNLPRLSEKTIVLFPEEYANSFVNPYYQNEMNRLKQNMNKSKQKLHFPAKDHNPEVLYNTIYQKIAFKYQHHVHFTQRQSIRHRKMSQGKSASHFNSSIYNNFKVVKHRADNSLLNLRTLNIMAANY